MKSNYIQDVWPLNTCYGCGPANPHGLQIKSRWSDDGLFFIAGYSPDSKYNSGMPDVMYGGAVASVIDCHSIWTAIAFAHKAANREVGSDPAIVYVTGTLTVQYLKPTPLSGTLFLKSWVEGEIGKKVHVLCELGQGDTVTARGDVIAIRLGL